MERPLSYSSASLLLNCERKYYHHKIAQTPKDFDIDESTKAFDIGKAFHEVLEETLHEQVKFTDTLLKETVIKYNVEEEELRIKGMLYKYFELHNALNLKCIACEIELKTEDFIGYVDVILLNPNTGGWWIADLKTASTIDTATLNGLTHNMQLNLYTHFVSEIAIQLNLKIKDFKGVRYRVTTKSRLKQKKGESDEDYTYRVFDNIKSIDVPVTASKLQVKDVWGSFKALHQRTLDMSNISETTQNFSYCNAYFKPCQFWSKCHGTNFTKSNIKVLDIATVQELKSNGKI